MSDTYQSRVFTFISNRTNQLKNNCAKGLRHLKVAVVWSGQILLYPLQLLAQTKIFQPQISTPPPTALPQPVPDINIEQALDLVEVAGYPIQIAERGLLVADDWSFIDENLWNTGYGNTSIKSQEIAYSPRKSLQVTAPKPTIRGLSSLLSNRQLVLVTTDNQLLNILTLSQQQEIRRQIGVDLVTIWDRWDLDRELGNYNPQELAAQQQLLLTNGTIPDPDDALNLPSPNLLDRLRNWFQNSIDPPTQLATTLSPSTVIAATAPAPPRQLAPSTYTFNPQPPRFDRYLELPQLPSIIDDIAPQPQDSGFDLAIANIVTKIQPDWLKKWWNYYREYVYIPTDVDLVDSRADFGEIVHAPDEFKLTPIEPTPSQIKGKQVKLSQTPQQLQIEQNNSLKVTTKVVHVVSQNENRQIEYHPDWIEAEAEPIGYSQSLLAQLLAWLDRLMFRLENWVLTVVRHLIAPIEKWF
jgi:hypothetical protein